MDTSRSDDVSQDLQFLRILAVFHGVVAVLMALFSLFPVIHLVIGTMMLSGGFDAGGDPMGRFVGCFFVLVSVGWIGLGLATAACVALAGRSLLRLERYLFCLVVAGVECVFVPFGTVLGVLTLIVLCRPSVRALFEEGGATAQP